VMPMELPVLSSGSFIRPQRLWLAIPHWSAHAVSCLSAQSGVANLLAEKSGVCQRGRFLQSADPHEFMGNVIAHKAVRGCVINRQRKWPAVRLLRWLERILKPSVLNWEAMMRLFVLKIADLRLSSRTGPSKRWQITGQSWVASKANDLLQTVAEQQFINGLKVELESIELGGIQWTLKTDVGPLSFPKVPTKQTRLIQVTEDHRRGATVHSRWREATKIAKSEHFLINHPDWCNSKDAKLMTKNSSDPGRPVYVG